MGAWNVAIFVASVKRAGGGSGYFRIFPIEYGRSLSYNDANGIKPRREIKNMTKPKPFTVLRLYTDTDQKRVGSLHYIEETTKNKALKAVSSQWEEGKNQTVRVLDIKKYGAVMNLLKVFESDKTEAKTVYKAVGALLNLFEGELAVNTLIETSRYVNFNYFKDFDPFFD